MALFSLLNSSIFFIIYCLGILAKYYVDLQNFPFFSISSITHLSQYSLDLLEVGIRALKCLGDATSIVLAETSIHNFGA